MRHGVDEADDLLGKDVALRGLAREDERGGLHLKVGIVADAVVEVHDLEDVEQLALVGVEALDLHVKEHGAVELLTRGLLDVVGQTALCLGAGVGHLKEEALVVRQLLKLDELRGVVHPAVANGVGDQLGVGRVGLGKEAPGADAVGLVVELLGRERVEVLEDRALENVRVKVGHAVDGVRADDGQIGHAHLAVPEDGRAAQEVLPVLAVLREGIAVAAVDLVDVHVGARDQATEGLDGPLLQRLGHDRVVGVGDGLGDDLPSLVPLVALAVHEQTHELGAAHGGVGVVGVDGNVLGQLTQVITVLALERAQDGLESSGDEQVLLLEAQDAAVLAGVVGVEDRGDGLDVGAEAVGARVVAGVECVKVKVLVRGLGRPDAEVVDGLAAVTDDGHVVGHGADLLAALPAVPVVAVLLLMADDVTTKADRDGTLGLADLPGVGVLQPVVGLLDLAAVLDLLTEQAVAVAHAVAKALDALVGHGVKEAGGKAT